MISSNVNIAMSPCGGIGYTNFNNIIFVQLSKLHEFKVPRGFEKVKENTRIITMLRRFANAKYTVVAIKKEAFDSKGIVICIPTVCIYNWAQ